MKKNNLLVAFVNMGECMRADRLDDYSSNIYLLNHHVVGVAECSQDLTDHLENTNEYSVYSDGTKNLAIVLLKVYVQDCVKLDQGSMGTDRAWSRFAIFKVKWKGIVGGMEETVFAVFHLHYSHAKAGDKTGLEKVGERSPVYNRFWMKFAEAI